MKKPTDQEARSAERATGKQVKVEILGQVTHISGQVRVIARDAEGRYALGTVARRGHDDTETFAPIVPWMTFADVARCADNILAGEPRATTWPVAHLALALGIAAMRCELEFPDPGRAPPSAPLVPAAAPAAGDAPAAEPARAPVAGDDLTYQHSLSGALEKTMEPT